MADVKHPEGKQAVGSRIDVEHKEYWEKFRSDHADEVNALAESDYAQ